MSFSAVFLTVFEFIFFVASVVKNTVRDAGNRLRDLAVTGSIIVAVTKEWVVALKKSTPAPCQCCIQHNSNQLMLPAVSDSIPSESIEHNTPIKERFPLLPSIVRRFISDWILYQTEPKTTVTTQPPSSELSSIVRSFNSDLILDQTQPNITANQDTWTPELLLDSAEIFYDLPSTSEPALTESISHDPAKVVQEPISESTEAQVTDAQSLTADEAPITQADVDVPAKGGSSPAGNIKGRPEVSKSKKNRKSKNKKGQQPSSVTEQTTSPELLLDSGEIVYDLPSTSEPALTESVSHDPAKVVQEPISESTEAKPISAQSLTADEAPIAQVDVDVSAKGGSSPAGNIKGRTEVTKSKRNRKSKKGQQPPSTTPAKEKHQPKVISPKAEDPSKIICDLPAITATAPPLNQSTPIDSVQEAHQESSAEQTIALALESTEAKEAQTKSKPSDLAPVSEAPVSSSASAVSISAEGPDPTAGDEECWTEVVRKKKIVRAPIEPEEEEPEEAQIHVFVPDHQIGLVLGKGHANRKKLEARHKVRIEVLPADSPKSLKANAKGEFVVVLRIRGQTEQDCMDAGRDIKGPLLVVEYLKIKPYESGIVIGRGGETIQDLRCQHEEVFITVFSGNPAKSGKIRFEGTAKACRAAKEAVEALLLKAQQPCANTRKVNVVSATPARNNKRSSSGTTTGKAASSNASKTVKPTSARRQ